MKFLYAYFIGTLLLFFSCQNNPSKIVDNNNRIDILLSQAKDSLDSNPTFASSKLRCALNLAQDSAYFYKAYISYINYYFTINAYDTAFQMTKRMLHYCTEPPFTLIKLQYLVQSYNFTGNYYNQMGCPDSAIFYYKLAYKYAQSDTSKMKIPDICINLADMFIRKGDYIHGIFFYRKALFVSDSLHITDKMGFPIYLGLGQAYYAGLRYYNLADNYFNLAEKYYSTRTLNEKFVFCNNHGNSYFYQGKYKEALLWFQKAKALVAPRHVPFSLNLCYTNLGDVYLKLNQLDSAQYFVDKAFVYFSHLKNPTILYYIATIKAGIALKRGDTQLAFQFLDNNRRLGKQIDPEIITLRNKCWEDYYIRIHDFKHAFEYQTLNIKQNDSLRAERMHARIAEIDLRYRQDTIIMKREFHINLQDDQIKTLRLSNYIWLLLWIIALIVTILSYFYKKRIRDLQQIKHQEQIAKLRLQNIRNRISPHFIFNVLNREISTEADKEKHKNLFNLVKVMRHSLELAERTSVSLIEELEFVKIYIDLESKRLGDNFEITWKVDERVDPTILHLPAMMLQIPIENAMKHALRAKIGKKLLSITITAHDNGGIHITIEDNGDGYYPETQKNSDSTGTGLKVLYQTIELLNDKNKEKISFTIANITDTGKTGTRVEIYIPDNYSFE
jgi:tetratricopeptide (TPR) repeat protein